MFKNFFLFLILWAGVYNPYSSAQPMSKESAPYSFNEFLSMFQTIYLNDTLVDLSYWYRMDEFNSPLKEPVLYKKYVNTTSPFFKSRPVAKFRKGTYWYIIALSKYYVANIQLLYVEIISFSNSAEIKDRLCLKVLDEHGGLYGGLDERRLNQGYIYISSSEIIYQWYEQMSEEQEYSVNKSQYILDENGLIEQSSSLE